MQCLILMDLEDSNQYPELCRVMEDVEFPPLSGKELRRDALFRGEIGRDSPEDMVSALTLLAWMAGIKLRRVSAFQAASREFPSILPRPEDLLLPLIALRRTLQGRQPVSGQGKTRATPEVRKQPPKGAPIRAKG